MKSPTARTLERLRQLGYLAAVVEAWIPRLNRKRDLFGIGDVLAVHPRDRLFLLVQATTAGHVGDRLRRVQARPELPALLRAGVAVEVWGWARSRGGKWAVKRVAVQAGDLQAVVLEQPPRKGRQRQRGLFDGPEAALPSQDTADVG